MAKGIGSAQGGDWRCPIHGRLYSVTVVHDRIHLNSDEVYYCTECLIELIEREAKPIGREVGGGFKSW